MFKWLRDWRAYNKEFKRKEGMPWFEMLKESVEKDLKKASDKKLSMLFTLVEDLLTTVDAECMKRTADDLEKDLGYRPEITENCRGSKYVRTD